MDQRLRRGREMRWDEMRRERSKRAAAENVRKA